MKCEYCGHEYSDEVCLIHMTRCPVMQTESEPAEADTTPVCDEDGAPDFDAMTVKQLAEWAKANDIKVPRETARDKAETIAFLKAATAEADEEQADD